MRIITFFFLIRYSHFKNRIVKTGILFITEKNVNYLFYREQKPDI